MSNQIFDLNEYAKKSREAVAEGIVLLKNDNQVLPLSTNAKLAVFGRSQFHYYKSGTGSGGLVNTNYVVGILDALENSDFIINQKVKHCYEEWLQENPYEMGRGWADEPWFQKEMPITSDLVRKAKEESDIAVIIIGRTAGEDQDNKAEEGSYLLTDIEENMLREVCSVFDKTVVLLNVGNTIDMKWVDTYNPTAVLYVWQGGQEGGNGVLDILDGTVTPSGRLTDTIAYDINDYPSTECFGDAERNFYIEDIYVGYRYFETFAKDKVLYPFGYGLSYTTFKSEVTNFKETNDQVEVQVKVTNTGSCKGKEVVQLYYEAPQGKLGKPARNLCGFAKTKTLQSGESEIVTITCTKYALASFDDSGVTGHKSSYVLEEGEYHFYLGDNVRNAIRINSIQIDQLHVVKVLSEAMAPTASYKRIKPVMSLDGNYEVTYELVPQRTIDPISRRNENLPIEYAQTGNQGYKLEDVFNGKVSLESFISQLSDEDLFCIVRGEGMCSTKVTPGTAGAFGGVTEELLGYGIPIGCCADGPSGIRMDCGSKAFAMPNGTCLACTFNESLIEELFEFEGLELRKNHIDTLLGPGMNLHRNPLNGRNFEYFSEDPLLTGKIAVAQLRGMHKYGVTGTIKHFACNNQEFRRHNADSVVSERALREIYLKGFEIVVQEGSPFLIMSTYGPMNGLWTSSHYDLLTTVLREEWGYEGLVMTDWWAKGNDEGEDGSTSNTAAMVRSQNDLFMVTSNAKENTGHDNSEEGLKNGKVTRGEFQRSAMNICKALMKLPAFLRMRGIETELDQRLKECTTTDEEVIVLKDSVEFVDQVSLNVDLIDTQKGINNAFQAFVKEHGMYKVSITCRANAESSLAQIPLSVFRDQYLEKSITLTGLDTQWRTEEFMIGPIFRNTFYLKFYFGQSGMEIKDCTVTFIKSV